MSSEELSKLSGDSTTEKRSLSPTNGDRISTGLENDVEKMETNDVETKPEESKLENVSILMWTNFLPIIFAFYLK